MSAVFITITSQFEAQMRFICKEAYYKGQNHRGEFHFRRPARNHSNSIMLHAPPFTFFAMSRTSNIAAAANLNLGEPQAIIHMLMLMLRKSRAGCLVVELACTVEPRPRAWRPTRRLGCCLVKHGTSRIEQRPWKCRVMTVCDK